jgi:hypothetical protein
MAQPRALTPSSRQPRSTSSISVRASRRVFEAVLGSPVVDQRVQRVEALGLGATLHVLDYDAA